MKPTVSIIIPTFNNPKFLNPCIDSIIASGALNRSCELIVVNNGEQPVKDYVRGVRNIQVLEPGTNLGWEGGLALGLKHSESEYVCFQNDDTLIPKATQDFYEQLLWPFQNLNVAAVGPATTVASGWHSIFSQNPVRYMTEVSFLIFFTVMIKRQYLDQVGGVDTTAPGGDDFDLSIRLRKAGYKLLINPDAFIIHHGFKTGERVRGTKDVAGGWNSPEMTERTNQWLIQKHGFANYLDTIRGLALQSGSLSKDSEGELIASMVRGPAIVELGCGFRKTVPEAIGVDQCEKGEPCSNLIGDLSVADVQADVRDDLPFEDSSIDTIIARHIVEHCIDLVDTLKKWARILKPNGQLIIAVPNQNLRNTIPLNPEHVHAFTPDSLKAIVELCGFTAKVVADPQNGISFVTVFEKNPIEIAQSESAEKVGVEC